MSAVLIPVELSRWDGDWMHMASLQHATMYGMVILCAVTGLCMDSALLPYPARFVVGLCFHLCGSMFSAHAQEGAYNEAVHVLVSQLFFAAGAAYVVYAALLATSHTVTGLALSAALQSVTGSGGSGKSGTAMSSAALVLSLLFSLTSVSARLTSLLVMLSGSWLLHIALTLFSPWARPSQRAQRARGAHAVAAAVLALPRHRICCRHCGGGDAIRIGRVEEA